MQGLKTYGVWGLFSAGCVGAVFACGAEGSVLDNVTSDPVPSDATVDATPLTNKDAPSGDADSTSAPDTDGGAGDVKLSADGDAGDARDASDAHDSAVDPPGTPCLPAGTVQQRACGLCGTESRVCLNTGAGAVWQTWGSCVGEVDGGCVPGTSATAPCGLCGTVQRTCVATCTWIEGICSNEPVNACEPGLMEYTDGLSCGADAGRVRTCQQPSADGGADGGPGGCTWGAYSADCRGPLTTLEVSNVVGQAVGLTVPFVQQNIEVYRSYANDGGANCTVYTYDAGSSYADRAGLVKVTNTTAKTVVATLWAGAASTGTPATDIKLTMYNGAQLPPPSYANCSRYAGGNCSQYYACSGVPTTAFAAFYTTTDGGGLTDKVTLAPGASVVVYVADYSYSYYPPYPDSAALFARTDQAN